MREVARLAGVSVGTVSNVLNNPDRVAKATLERVEKAIQEVGFVPNSAAGQLRSRKSSMVGVVVPDVGNPYWASVLRGIERVLESQNLTMVVGSTRQDPQRQKQIISALLSQQVDGMIIAPVTRARPSMPGVENRRFGAVVLDQDGRDSKFAQVSVDDVRGGELAAGHLLACGHKNVAFINGPKRVSWCNARSVGVQAAVADAAMLSGQAPATVLEVEVPDLTVEEGERAVRELIESGAPFSAVICANDMLALGALTALKAHGLNVPGDVAIVGYDDVDFARALEPALTTIRQPSFEIGEAAARLLLDGEQTSAETVRFTPELVIRDSTKVM